MQRIGHLAELWRYPVKSMRGEQLTAAAFDSTGMVGDRRFAIVSSAAPAGKPLLTSRERTRMLLYAPALDPTPHVLTPTGEHLALPSPELIATLQDELASPGATLAIRHSPEKPLTDVRAVSFVSTATLRFLTRELGEAFAPQRLRNNLVLNLENPIPFAEEALAGARLRLGDGPEAPVLHVLERIPRCRIVTLDPVTSEGNPKLLHFLARYRNHRVAMYASMLHPGKTMVMDSVYVM